MVCFHSLLFSMKSERSAVCVMNCTDSLQFPCRSCFSTCSENIWLKNARVYDLQFVRLKESEDYTIPRVYETIYGGSFGSSLTAVSKPQSLFKLFDLWAQTWYGNLLPGKFERKIYKHKINCGCAIVFLTLIYNLLLKTVSTLFNKKQNISSQGWLVFIRRAVESSRFMDSTLKSSRFVDLCGSFGSYFPLCDLHVVYWCGSSGPMLLRLLCSLGDVNQTHLRCIIGMCPIKLQTHTSQVSSADCVEVFVLCGCVQQIMTGCVLEQLLFSYNFSYRCR